MSILSFENDNLPHPALYRLWHSYISHFILFRRANTIGARLKEHSVLKLKLDGHNLPSHRVSRFSDFFQIICSILEGPITCILPIEYFRFHICSIGSFWYRECLWQYCKFAVDFRMHFVSDHNDVNSHLCRPLTRKVINIWRRFEWDVKTCIIYSEGPRKWATGDQSDERKWTIEKLLGWLDFNPKRN